MRQKDFGFRGFVLYETLRTAGRRRIVRGVRTQARIENRGRDRGTKARLKPISREISYAKSRNQFRKRDPVSLLVLLLTL